VIEGIRLEREKLGDIRRLADHVLDTSGLTVHDLRRAVNRLFTGSSEGFRMNVKLVSFGYRHGLPEQADLTVDVRFLPNPNFIDALRPRTGLDPAVADYVLERPETQTFLTKFCDLVDFLVPLTRRGRRTSPSGSAAPADGIAPW
jgi:UPF0042 nucleotide-binding protein